MFNALIDGQQRVELAVSSSQLCAVLDASRARLLHRAHVVARRLAPESLGYAFIER